MRGISGAPELLRVVDRETRRRPRGHPEPAHGTRGSETPALLRFEEDRFRHAGDGALDGDLRERRE
ncbi:MAG TPA: hypothetical protein VGU43_01895, partial [Thermoplasmata archaeon]|nr:hypothetical protein [Thermoplasmata archaeon]